MKMPAKRPTASQMRKARLLAESVTSALANGVIHRDREGNILGTPKEVLECLRREGEVLCEDPVKA